MEATSAPGRTGLTYRLLGRVAVSCNGHDVQLAGARQKALLALLLLRANGVVATSTLVDELFGDEPPSNAPNAVHAGISRLRRQLAAGGACQVPIVTRPPGYMLDVGPGELDLLEFGQLAERGRRELQGGNAVAAAETLKHALALWTGHPLADLEQYEFARMEAERMKGLRTAAVIDLFEADLALGRHAELVPELETLALQHPLHERVRGQLMLALYRAGRQADALHVYQDVRRLLVAELGLEPGKPLRELERKILTHDTALDLAQAVVEPRPEVTGAWRRKRSLAALGGAALAAVALVAAVAALALDEGAPETRLTSIAPNSIGVIDPSTNSLTVEIPVGQSPKGIAASVGSVWVVNTEDSTASLVDGDRRVVLRTVAVPGRPSDLALGAAAWVLHNRPGSTQDPFAGDAAVSKIDIDLLGLTKTFEVPAGFGNQFRDPIALGAGAIWVGGPTGVSRVDLETGRVGARILLREVLALAVAGDHLWVAQLGGLARVDTSTDVVDRTIELTGGTVPAELALDERSIWVASHPGTSCCPTRESGTGTVTRVDRGTNEVVATIDVGGFPRSIAVGESGVWVAAWETNEVVRIDPESNRVVARISVGARPTSITVGDGLVWITASS